MTEEQFNDALANPADRSLCWFEPWRGADSEGDDVDVHVEMRASVRGCINLQRRAILTTDCNGDVPDDRLLSDFIAVHWASLVEEPK